MREQIKQDIDLIEILFYLKKKIRVILFIMAICMAMVLDLPLYFQTSVIT